MFNNMFDESKEVNYFKELTGVRVVQCKVL